MAAVYAVRVRRYVDFIFNVRADSRDAAEDFACDQAVRESDEADADGGFDLETEAVSCNEGGYEGCKVHDATGQVATFVHEFDGSDPVLIRAGDQQVVVGAGELLSELGSGDATPCPMNTVRAVLEGATGAKEVA